MIRATIYTNTTHFQKQVWTLTCLISAFLLFTGCTMMSNPIVSKSESSSQVTEKGEQEAIELCKAETAPTSRERLVHLKNSREMFKDVGRDAGSLSDDVSGRDKDTGAKFGEKAGGVIGFIGGMWDVTQVDSSRKKAMRECLEARGYDVKGWS